MIEFFQDALSILTEHYPFLLRGIGYTMLIALVGTVAGLLIGLATGVLRTCPMSKNPVVRFLQKVINGIIAVYVEVFRGTPMMVQAMVIYWGFAFASGGATLPLIPSGILIVSINTGAYMAEIVRGGIISIDKGQFEGAAAVGMTHWQAMLHIILPQVLRNILPSVANEFVINIKDTSVLNVISVSELFFVSKSAAGTYFKYFEVFFITSCVYFVMTFTITRLLRWLEKKMDGPENYAIHGSQTVPAVELIGKGGDKNG